MDRPIQLGFIHRSQHLPFTNDAVRLLRCLRPIDFSNLPCTFSSAQQLCDRPCDRSMGNKPAKEQRDEVVLMVVPPIDQAYIQWLARDLERIHRFTPRNPRPIRPPDHYIEYMRMNGWLDVSLDDPDLAHLIK